MTVHLVMPKKGSKTVEQQTEESNEAFVALRKKQKAPGKGIRGFKRYVALGVLAYNIKRLEKLVMEQ